LVVDAKVADELNCLWLVMVLEPQSARKAGLITRVEVLDGHDNTRILKVGDVKQELEVLSGKPRGPNEIKELKKEFRRDYSAKTRQ
jgi:hypothetical protein